jgi:hypothetical protein
MRKRERDEETGQLIFNKKARNLHNETCFWRLERLFVPRLSSPRGCPCRRPRSHRRPRPPYLLSKLEIENEIH